MTRVEAADRVLRASGWRFDLAGRTAVYAAVEIILNAARADALKDAADICATLAETTYDDADGFEAALGCEAAIRRYAQSHREPKP